MSTNLALEPVSLLRGEGAYDVRVASFNIFLRPPVVNAVQGMHDRSFCRASLLGRALVHRDYDILGLQEAHNESALKPFRRSLRGHYPVRLFGVPARIEGFGIRPVHGGLGLLSRFAIERWESHGFDVCSGVDCLARKGFVHAVLRVSRREKLNLIVVHANAGGSRKKVAARASQFEQLGFYLRRNPSFRQWPTVLLGDLNVDGRLYQQQSTLAYRRMKIALTIPGLPEPSDVFLTELRKAGLSYADIATTNCLGNRLAPCRQEEVRRRARNDYVLVWLPPSHELSTSLVHVDSFENAPARPCGASYLSDHAAVSATLSFRRHNRKKISAQNI